jgi:PAS domain S-box-containing protein
MPGISNIFVFLVIFSTLAGFSKRLRGQLEQKRQWRLQEAERKYRTLVENVPAITYVNKADRNGRALYVSPQTQTLLGIPPEEWMSDGVSTRFSLIHPDDIDRVWTKFDCFLENGAPLDLEYRVKAPDGRLLWIQDRAIMLRDDSGYPDSIQGVMHDVTERKQTEEKLRRTEKELQTLNAELEKRVAERTAEFNRTNAELERASCAKDEFLANMSHELRTPLNSILGLSESLLEERRGSLNNYQQKSLQIIGSSGQHLLELINDILDLSKIQAGKFDFYPQNISVAELCRSSLSFVKAQAAKKFIEVNYDNQSAVTEIFADARRLKQALVNLLTNAVKFTAQHGHVTLRVTTKLEQNLIQFSVIDDGVGIALEDLQRLFQPFVQVDSSLNRQYEGTGLGLALVQKLIDLHAGSIEVISEVGKGSCFTLNLACSPNGMTKAEETSPPIEYAARETSENVEISESPAHERVILLAEDNMSNVLTIGEYLESHDYKVIVAHDGVEAITKAMESNPELILMDIQMPAMNGLEAIAHLRADLRFAATPIIALTALAMPGDRERCLQVGANEYMSKPVSLKMLAKTIESMLKLGRAK